MIPDSYHIRSSNFPVTQEDIDECVNPGTYGKSLVDYLQQNLELLGYEIPFTVAEDFGWWIEIKTDLGVSTSIIVCRSNEDEDEADFGIALDYKDKKWSWRKCKKIDVKLFKEKLSLDLQKILANEDKIKIVAFNLEEYGEIAEQGI